MVKVSEMFPESGTVPALEVRSALAPAGAGLGLARAKADAVAFAGRVRAIKDRLPQGKLADDKQARTVESLMGSAQAALKEIEAARKAATKPLKDEAKAIEDIYRPLSTSLDEVVRHCGPLLAAWIKAKQQEQQRAELEARRLRLEAEQREIEARLAADRAESEDRRRERLAEASDAMQDQAVALLLTPPPIRGIATAGSKHSLVSTWHAVVANLAEIPREYLMANQQALDDALAAAVRRMRVDGKETPDFNVPGVTLELRDGLRRGRGVY